MPLDFARLGEEIRARAVELYGEKNAQEELIRRSTASRSTVQRLWAGTAKSRPTAKTQEALERALHWEPGSIALILDGGMPTPVRETGSEETTPDSNTASDAGTSAPIGDVSTLPRFVRAELDDGEMLDYERLDWTVAGTQLHLYIFVKAGTITTEQETDSVKRQFEEWVRLKKGIRELVEESTDDPLGTASD